MKHYSLFILLLIINTSPGMDYPSKRIIRQSTSAPGSRIQLQHMQAAPQSESKPLAKGALLRSTTQRLGQDLLTASKEGDYQRVKSLLVGNAPVNPAITDDQQETPLFAALAAPFYNDKIVAKLLDHHANPNQKVQGIAPLSKALQLKREKAALRLIYAGAHINTAIELDKTFLAKELFYEIKKGQKARLDRIRYLLKLNAPVNHQVTDETGEQETPLLCTITEPQRFNKILFEEIAAVANVNQCAHNGLSPFWKSILCVNEEAAITLALRNADHTTPISLYQNIPLTALQIADHMNMPHLIKTIQGLECGKKASEENLKEKIDKDAVLAVLEKQTTPRTKSPRVTTQKS